MIFQDLVKWKKSSTVEAYVLWTLGQVFTPEKGRALGPSLFFGAHHSAYCPCA